jgi:hypothetical protein
MEQQANKHSPKVDEELKHELEQTLAGGRQSHVEEWRQAEPSGEDQPELSRTPEGSLEEGTPPGLDLADVERRSQLASYLGKNIWPADRDALIAHAEEGSAPDAVLNELRRLPSGREFVNTQEVWASLGHSVEEHRT